MREGYFDSPEVVKSMKTGKALLKVSGLVVGVAGAYLIVRSYQRAKAHCPPFRKRIYTRSQQLLEDFRALWDHPEDLWALRSHFDPVLASKLMLVVTGAQGGSSSARVCEYALKQGLSQQAVSSLSRGELIHATVEEAPMLVFAQHYAERRGMPDPEMLERFVESYSPQTVRDVITYLRLATFVNMAGGTLDALISRLLGQPCQETTLSDELCTLGVLVFGILPLIPALVWRVIRVAYTSK